MELNRPRASVRILRIMALVLAVSVFWGGGLQPAHAQMSQSHALCWSRDGRFVAACSETSATVFNVMNGRAVCTVHPPALLTGVALSPRGRFLAVGILRSRIELYQVSDGKLVREMVGDQRFGGGYVVEFSADGRWLCSTGDSRGHSDADPVVRLWDVPTGAQISTLAGPRSDLSPHGGWMVANNSVEETVIYQPVPAGRRHRFDGARLPSQPFRADDRCLAIIDDQAHQLRMIALPDGPKLDLMPITHRHEAIVLSPGFHFVALTRRESDPAPAHANVVQIIGLRPHRVVAEIRGVALRATAISRQHVVLIEDAVHGQFQFVSTLTGKPVATVHGGTQKGTHSQMYGRFSHDGRLFGVVDADLGSSGDGLRVVDGLTGRTLWTRPIDR